MGLWEKSCYIGSSIEFTTSISTWKCHIYTWQITYIFKFTVQINDVELWFQNAALNTIQQDWFKASSHKLSNPSEVEDFLSCFNEISRDLLINVVNMADANVSIVLIAKYSYAPIRGNLCQLPPSLSPTLWTFWHNSKMSTSIHIFSTDFVVPVTFLIISILFSFKMSEFMELYQKTSLEDSMSVSYPCQNLLNGLSDLS